MTISEESKQTVDRMVDLALAGRGLWIGLPAERSPEHELLKLELDTANPNVVTERTKDTHVTVAHLGKKNDRRQVEAAITAASVVAGMKWRTSVGVECLARFWGHIVAIVEPRWIDGVCDQIDQALLDRHVYRDESFVGIRHVTMVSIRRDMEHVKIPRIRRYKLDFNRLSVFCGGQEFAFPLAEAMSAF